YPRRRRRRLRSRRGLDGVELPLEVSGSRFPKVHSTKRSFELARGALSGSFELASGSLSLDGRSSGRALSAVVLYEPMLADLDRHDETLGSATVGQGCRHCLGFRKRIAETGAFGMPKWGFF